VDRLFRFERFTGQPVTPHGLSIIALLPVERGKAADTYRTVIIKSGIALAKEEMEDCRGAAPDLLLLPLRG
jgi:hypothetical protein